MAILAPTITASLASWTKPLIVPVETWAVAEPVSAASSSRQLKIRTWFAPLFERNELVLVQTGNCELGIALGGLERQGRIGAEGAGRAEGAGHANVNFAHRERGEIAGLGMAAEIDEVQQGSSALAHQGHFDQRVGVGADLALRKQAVEQVAKQSGMGREAMPVIESAEIPGQPDGGPLAQAARDDRRSVRILHIDVDELGRADHGRRH